MPRAVLHIVSGHVAELQVVSSSQDALDCPLGELASVVLQLVGEHRAALGVQLLAPVHSAAAPGVPLVQRFQVDELGLAIGPLETDKMMIRSGASELNRHAYLLNSIQLTTADQIDIISKIPPEKRKIVNRQNNL